MSYHMYICRKEARENESTTEDSWLVDENLFPFSPEQQTELHEKLLECDFIFDGEDTYTWDNDSFDIEANIRKNYMVFTTPKNDSIGEAAMILSVDFLDHVEYEMYDPQDGGWQDYE
jgi:hypothetical protein